MQTVQEALENPKARFFYEDALLLFNEAKDLIKNNNMPTDEIYLDFMGWIVLSSSKELGYYGLRDTATEWRLLEGRTPKFSIFFESAEIANKYGLSSNRCLVFESKKFTKEGYERLAFFKQMLDLEAREQRDLNAERMADAKLKGYSQEALEVMTKPSNKDLKKKYIKDTKNQKYGEVYQLPLP